MTGKVVATFDSPVTAELAHNYLAEHGLHPMLQNEEAMAVFSSMTNLVGGVKLLVPEDEEMAAEDLLANLPKPESDPSSEAIVPAGMHIDADPESLEESPADRDARYAFRAMVLGLVIFLLPFPLAVSMSNGRASLFGLTLVALPMQLHGLYLLVRIGKSEGRLSPRYRWTPLWCILLFLPLWGVIGVGLATLFNAFDDPNGPHWRGTSIAFSNDSAMYAELPAPFATEHFRKETPIGPMKHTADRAVQGDCMYWATVDVPINPAEVEPGDETIETLAKAAAEKNGRTIVSSKWIEHRGHTGIEYRMTQAGKRGQTLHGRAQMFRVGDRFLEIGLLGENAGVTDDGRAQRFFGMLRIP